MKHLLLSLANNPKRAMRLLAFALDCLGPDCNNRMKVDIAGDNYGVISFSGLWLPGGNCEITPERRFASIRVWLEGSSAQPHVVEAFCQQGGVIASSQEEAHLLVADFLELESLEERWPRKLVIPRAEFEAQVIGDGLRPLRVKFGAPGGLPKALRGIWNQLKSGSVRQIHAGLDEFRVLAADDPATGDLLLEEVGVDAATGTLILGNRFQRAKEEANPHLLYGLLGLLSRSAADSRGSQLSHAIRKLNAVCPSLPEIKGFIALQELEIGLSYSYDPDEEVEAAIADRFDALPALEILWIHAIAEQSIRSAPPTCNQIIRSLDGLIAPRLWKLYVAGIGLKDIQALAGNTALESVDLGGNDQLGDISPLQASAASLKQLDFSSTAVKDLSVLAQSGELESLVFHSSPNINSLKGLETLTITNKCDFQIYKLKNLTDLQYLPKISSGHISLSELPGLTSLEGIESAADHITAYPPPAKTQRRKSFASSESTGIIRHKQLSQPFRPGCDCRTDCFARS